MRSALAGNAENGSPEAPPEKLTVPGIRIMAEEPDHSTRISSERKAVTALFAALSFRAFFSRPSSGVILLCRTGNCLLDRYDPTRWRELGRHKSPGHRESRHSIVTRKRQRRSPLVALELFGLQANDGFPKEGLKHMMLRHAGALAP
jgi:hypothetical protein